MKLPRLRLTVRRAMALTTWVAVGLAAIRPLITSWGPREFTTFALNIIVATNVLAWFRRQRRQVFWIGFGLAGWAYLALALASPLAETLPTSRLLEALHDRLYGGRSFPEYITRHHTPDPRAFRPVLDLGLVMSVISRTRFLTARVTRPPRRVGRRRVKDLQPTLTRR